MKLTSKLIIAFLGLSLIPLIIVITIANNSFNIIEEENLKFYEDTSASIADLIDRNLFERYGDVQAFSLNGLIQNKENWYKQGESTLSEMMNKYVDTYDIYYLTLLVDTQGKLISINTKDQDGEALDTSSLFQKNFAESPWFKALKENKFTTGSKMLFLNTCFLLVFQTIPSIYLAHINNYS